MTDEGKGPTLSAEAAARAAWKMQLVAFLLPHLRGSEGERSGAVNAVLLALDTARTEGLREASEFCRMVAAGASRHAGVAEGLAAGLDELAAQHDAQAAEDARLWQAGGFD